MMETENVNLECLLLEKIDLGQSLLASLDNPELKSVVGVTKLRKKIRQEAKFLQKFMIDRKSKLKQEHLNCSNLQHLSAIVKVLIESSKVISVLQPFSFESNKKVVVDVVNDDGFGWVKVVARNPKALDLNFRGGNQFGQRSLMDQVKDLLECARQNPKQFQIPTVTFMFHNGISEDLAQHLEQTGIRVMGTLVPSLPDHPGIDLNEDSYSESGESSEGDCHEEGLSLSTEDRTELDSNRINLDITAMIAYVSALTNGHSYFKFNEPILSKQAQWERDNPVKPFLDDVFAGKKLICCQSAMSDFKTILETLGGQGEKERAIDLFKRIEVMPDMMTERLRELNVSGKIKERSRAIFGTGDSLKVLTITANSGFVRAAKGQGVDLAVVIHESRALTEDKMYNSCLKNEL